MLPADPDPTAADADAARRIDGIANRLWYDPVLLGRYPDDVLADLAAVSDLDHIRDGDLAQIARPIDALGVNYYRCYHVRHEPGASAGGHALARLPRRRLRSGRRHADVERLGRRARADCTTPGPAGSATTTRRRCTCTRAARAFPDKVAADGQVHDHDRLAYLDAHLRASLDALAAGVDLRGLFVWSLLDNFEWAEGYRQRFGIVHVDFDTHRRTPKASAQWFRDVIAAHGLTGRPA